MNISLLLQRIKLAVFANTSRYKSIDTEQAAIVLRYNGYLKSFTRGEHTITNLSRFTEGSILTRVVMSPFIISSLVKDLLSPDDIYDILIKKGWKKILYNNPGYAKWLCSLLQHSNYERIGFAGAALDVLQDTFLYPALNLVHCTRFDELIILIPEDQELDGSLFLQLLGVQSSLVVFTQFSDDMNTVSVPTILPLSLSPLVVGDWSPGVDNLVEGLRDNKSVLCYGPSGVGKTQTCLNALYQLLQEDPNSNPTKSIALLSSDFIKAATRTYGRNSTPLINMIETLTLLKLSALILDDIEEMSSTDLLQILDVAAKANMYVAITVMTDKKYIRFPGLRPGRLNSIYHFRHLTVEDVITLVEGIFTAVGLVSEKDKVVEILKSPPFEHKKDIPRFTGAYIRELAKRCAKDSSDAKIESYISSLFFQLRIATAGDGEEVTDDD